MIIEGEKHDVSASGFASTKVAEIKATPQMLRMLSSGIYSDKITAFIRELSTNAVDSMIEKGTIDSHQFEVHLPTQLEPWFGIRDFGTGLSTIGMEENFSNFGDGTKANTNKYNGAFGLGSKSPLSYTRDFTIISYHNHVKTVYNYGKNEEDVPVLSTAFSEACTEHSGLEIQVPIEIQDIPEVLHKAERVYRYFDYRPKTNVDIQYQELNKIVKGDGWYLTDKDKDRRGYTIGTPTKVVMSNVAYPVSGLQHTDEFQWLQNASIVLEAQTGDVNITPSRETLEYTPKTKAFLKDKAEMILKDLGSNIEGMMPDLCYYEKVIKFQEFSHLLPNGVKSIKFGPFVVNVNRWSTIFKVDTSKLKLPYTFVRVSDRTPVGGKKRQEHSFKEGIYPMITMSYIFLVVNSNKRLPEILTKLKMKYDYVYVIRPGSDDKTNKFFENNKDNIINDSKLFLKELGDPKFVYSSDEFAKLPPLPIIPRGQKGVKVQGIKRAVAPITVFPCSLSSHSSFNTNKSNEVKIKADETGPFFYLDTHRGYFRSPHSNGGYYKINYVLQALLTAYNTKNKTSESIYAVTSISKDKVAKDKRFVEFLGFIKDNPVEIEMNEISEEVRKSIQQMYLNSNVKEFMKTKRKDSILGQALIAYDQRQGSLDAFSIDYIKELGCTVKYNTTFDIKGLDEAIKEYKNIKYIDYNAPKNIVKLFIECIEKEEGIKVESN